MAKGSMSKEIITQKILNTFAGSFINDKEIRIPMIEEGAPIQIKLSLTCAKTNVANPNDKMFFGDISTATIGVDLAATEDSTPDMTGPTEEEKQRVADLAKKLGL